MQFIFPLLLKGLLAGVIVGFVTASIKSWVDRFFPGHFAGERCRLSYSGRGGN